MTAVIAYNALVAHGLILAAADTGRSVPRDLALAAADDLTDIGLGLPEMTAITQPMSEAGYLAGQMLITQTRQSQQTNTGTKAETTPDLQRIVLPTTLTIGDTC